MINDLDFSRMKDGKDYKYYSNGEWRKSTSGDLIQVYNPYNNELIANVQACTKEEADEIIKVAHENIDCWNEIPLNKRAEILNKSASLMIEWSEKLGHLLMREIGKPLNRKVVNNL